MAFCKLISYNRHYGISIRLDVLKERIASLVKKDNLTTPPPNITNIAFLGGTNVSYSLKSCF